MKKPEQYIVIDDDHTNNFICDYQIRKFNPAATVILFEDSGLALKAILNGEEGINSRKRTVIFLDLNMPLISGWDFLDELKKNKFDILQHWEIYILSSSIENFSHKKDKYPFLTGYLSKPLTQNQLQKVEEKEKKLKAGREILKY